MSKEKMISFESISEILKEKILIKEIYSLINIANFFDENDHYRNQYIRVIFPGLMYENISSTSEEKTSISRIKQLLLELNLNDSKVYDILKDSVNFSKKERDEFIKVVEKQEAYSMLSVKQKERIRIAEENKRIEKEKVVATIKIKALFDSLRISEAIEFYETNPIMDHDDFIDLKTEAVQAWFKNKVLDEKGNVFLLDKQQARAVVDGSENVLVSARAGSGKTRVIVAKVIYLVEILKEDINSIMILAFNKSTPEEINKRLCKIKVNNKIFTEKQVAETFHAFAHAILIEEEGLSILVDKKKYVQAIIEKVKKEEKGFDNKVYSFFRKESFKVNRNQFQDEKQYFDFVRNSKYSTLDGKNVKSVAEKYISDFLFEHGINYTYEKSFYPNRIDINSLLMSDDEKERCRMFLEGKREVKPDFFLSDYNIVWEHWAIDGNESVNEQMKITDSGSIGDYKEYLENKKWKKSFWSSWRDRINSLDNYSLEIKSVKRMIETHKLNSKRDEFEKMLRIKLNGLGINVVKRNQEEIVEEVWEIAIKRFSEMITSYIDRFQQRFLNNEKEYVENKNNFVRDNRVSEFLNMGEKIYSEYLMSLKGEKELINNKVYNKDFNIIINDATKVLNRGVHSSLARKKHILIDEYQDFSYLFFEFIKSIRKHMPHSKLFCVGDDWQLVNRFAGSDDKYFVFFKNHFPKSTKLSISTNYRSASEIVISANKFMGNFFDSLGSIPFKKLKGISSLLNLDNDYLSDKDDIANDCLEYYSNSANRYDNAKYLWKLIHIIDNNKGKNFLILHRNNNFRSIEMEAFMNKLKSLLVKHKILNSNEISKKIRFETMHRSKGLEEDVVILLDINDGIIPMSHPDNILYEVFGETVLNNFMDQVRLFYVAITRPKVKLYILYEEKKKSSFLEILSRV